MVVVVVVDDFDGMIWCCSARYMIRSKSTVLWRRHWRGVIHDKCWKDFAIYITRT